MKIEEYYIDLLKKSLTDCIHANKAFEFIPLHAGASFKSKLAIFLSRFLEKSNHKIVRYIPYIKEKRINGLDHPANAESMIGLKRLDNLEYCIREIAKDNIDGDLIETGSWRGGATIFMRAMLKVLNINNKIVYVADSFEGLPKPEEAKYVIDKGDRHFDNPFLAVSLEQVKQNFENYNLLDSQVQFLKGWFKDTLPTAPVQKLSLLRLDGDMYQSTIEALDNLYPKLQKGGFCIIDDWTLKGANQAVLDYRKEHNIKDEIITIDYSSAFWRKKD